MKEYITHAPNGNRVLVNTGPYIDTEFKHGQIITNESLAASYPTIFRFLRETKPAGEKLMENKPQILTEVPKPKAFRPETDKPEQTTKSSDDSDDDSRKASLIKKLADLGAEFTSDSIDENTTKKQLESLCLEFNIEMKKLTKGKIIENILLYEA